MCTVHIQMGILNSVSIWTTTGMQIMWVLHSQIGGFRFEIKSLLYLRVINCNIVNYCMIMIDTLNCIFSVLYSTSSGLQKQSKSFIT